MEELTDYRCRIGLHSFVLYSTLHRGKRIGHLQKAKNGSRKKHSHIKTPRHVCRKTDMHRKMASPAVCQRTSKLRIFNQLYLPCLLISMTALQLNHFVLQYGGITVDIKSSYGMDWSHGVLCLEGDDLKASMHIQHSSIKTPEKEITFVWKEAPQTKFSIKDMKIVHFQTSNFHGTQFAENQTTLSTRVSLEYYNGLSCSYLIGNAGSYMYYGNPGNRDVDERAVLHSTMIAKLYKLVTSDIFRELKQLMTPYLDPRTLENCSDIFEICKELLIRDCISYGKYGILIRALDEIKAIQCSNLVKEFSKKIEASLGVMEVDGAKRPYSTSNDNVHPFEEADITPAEVAGSSGVISGTQGRHCTIVSQTDQINEQQYQQITDKTVADSATSSDINMKSGYVIQENVDTGLESIRHVYKSSDGITAKQVMEIVEPIKADVADIKKSIVQEKFKASECTAGTVINITAQNVNTSNVGCQSTTTVSLTSDANGKYPKQRGHELPGGLTVSFGQNLPTDELKPGSTDKKRNCEDDGIQRTNVDQETDRDSAPSGQIKKMKFGISDKKLDSGDDEISQTVTGLFRFNRPTEELDSGILSQTRTISDVQKCLQQSQQLRNRSVAGPSEFFREAENSRIAPRTGTRSVVPKYSQQPPLLEQRSVAGPSEFNRETKEADFSFPPGTSTKGVVPTYSQQPQLLEQRSVAGPSGFNLETEEADSRIPPRTRTKGDVSTYSQQSQQLEENSAVGPSGFNRETEAADSRIPPLTRTIGDVPTYSQQSQQLEKRSGEQLKPMKNDIPDIQKRMQRMLTKKSLSEALSKRGKMESGSTDMKQHCGNDEHPQKSISQKSDDLQFKNGRLELEKVDVIACTVDRALNLSISSVAKALLCADGKDLMDECRKDYPSGIEFGEIISMKPVNLSCKNIYLTTLPDYVLENKEEAPETRQVVKFVIDQQLRMALYDGMESIALPAIGRNQMNMSVEETETFMRYCVEESLQDQPTRNLKITFVLPDKPNVRDNSQMELTNYENRIFEIDMKSGSTRDHHIKLHALGHQGAGKSSLMQQLIFLDPTEDVEPTDGIEINYGTCNIDIDTGTWHKSKMTDYENLIKQIRGMELCKNDDHEENKDASLNQKCKGVSNNSSHKTPCKGDCKNETEMHSPASSDLDSKYLETLESNTQTENQEGEEIHRMPSNIDTRDVAKEVKNFPKESEMNEAIVHGFDFAGQSMYYTLHQLFLSKRGINIIVMDASLDFDQVVKDEDSERMCGKMEMTSIDFFKFWAKSLQFYLPTQEKKQIIVVFTHIDLVMDAAIIKEKIKKIKKIIEEMSMDNMFEKDICCINCKEPNPEHLQKLRDKIFNLAKDVHNWHKPLSCKWLLLEMKFKKNKKNKFRIMTMKDVNKLNRKSEELALDRNELYNFLKLHHDIGTFMYFAEKGIIDIVILDPQWLVDSLKLIINARYLRDESDQDRNEYDEFSDYGILSKQLIFKVWKESKHEQDNRFYELRISLTRLMEKLDLISCPKLYDGDGQFMESEYYIMPCMLKGSDKERILEFMELDSSSNESYIVFDFYNKFLPSAIVHRLLAACIKRYKSKYVEDQKILLYSDAAVFEVYDHHYLILQIQHHCVYVHVNVPIGINRDIGLCQGVREFLERTFECIASSPKRKKLYALKVPCGKMKNENEHGLLEWTHSVSPLICKDHGKRPGHLVERTAAFKWWLVDPTLEESNIQDLETGLSKKVDVTGKVKDLIINLLGNRYRKLGMELGFDEKELEEIETENNDDYKIANRILDKWIEREQSNATWKVLRDNMVKIGVGVDLIEEHCRHDEQT